MLDNLSLIAFPVSVGTKIIIFLEKSHLKISSNFHTKSTWKDTRFGLISRHIRVSLANFAFEMFAITRSNGKKYKFPAIAGFVCTVLQGTRNFQLYWTLPSAKNFFPSSSCSLKFVSQMFYMKFSCA
jgi:hypothetical protein